MGVVLLVFVALALAVGAGSASAGPPGTWTKITEADRNIDQVGVARTADRVLHVVWRKDVGALNEEIWHTPITPDGKAGAASRAATGFNSASDPDLIVMPDGSLRVFFGGLAGSNELDGVQSATAGADGGTWTPQGVRVSSTQSAVGPVGAALRPDGTPVYSYTLSFALGIHVGLNPADADVDLRTENLCCDYESDIAFDPVSGEGFLGWYSNITDQNGVWIQRILPSLGPRQLAPGSVENGDSVAPDQRTPITARRGAPGVYVAYCGGYPTCKRVLLWQIGAAGPLTVAQGSDVEDVNIAPAPDGRLWVMWHDPTTDLISATRSNKQATKFGEIVRIKPQKGTESIWKLAGEGSLGGLDVLASFTTPGSLAFWHTQVLPGLNLACSGGKVVKCTVTDAGEAVAGAKVKIKKKTLTTNAKGKVSVDLPRGQVRATTTKPGYTADTASARSA